MRFSASASSKLTRIDFYLGGFITRSERALTVMHFHSINFTCIFIFAFALIKREYPIVPVLLLARDVPSNCQDTVSVFGFIVAVFFKSRVQSIGRGIARLGASL